MNVAANLPGKRARVFGKARVCTGTRTGLLVRNTKLPEEPSDIRMKGEKVPSPGRNQ